MKEWEKMDKPFSQNNLPPKYKIQRNKVRHVKGNAEDQLGLFLKNYLLNWKIETFLDTKDHLKFSQQDIEKRIEKPEQARNE